MRRGLGNLLTKLARFVCNPFHFSLQAISNALDEQLQEVAWKAVVPLVGKLKMFYEYALELGKRPGHNAGYQ